MNQRSKLNISKLETTFKKQLVTAPETVLREKSAEFKINLNSMPYLKDHGFQDMVVLPGSAYVELALVIYYELYNRIPKILSNIKFKNLILLSEKDTFIKSRFKIEDKKGMKCKFYEYTLEGKEDFDNSATIIELDEGELNGLANSKSELAIENFINNASSTILADEFYKKLKANGNQYGPSFQNIEQIWIKDNEALGKLNPYDPAKNNSNGEYFLHPSLLDSFTQLLSSLSDSKGRTFVLNSIDKIHIHDLNVMDDTWCFAKIVSGRESGDSEFQGELKILNSSGLVVLELFGVKFKYLETEKKIEDQVKSKICISSTFTSDPIEDSLKYWSNFFNNSYDIEFAPYNQVFQELLNPQSLLSSNGIGFNVILLGLEDWTRKEHQLVPQVRQDELDKLFKDKLRYTLPNHLEIVHLNKYETEYVYKEIFVDKCYLKHGININDGDTIIDIGANIGLFTLFINQHCKDPIVYSFEPSPEVYDILKTNSEVYGSKVKTFNCGVSDKIKTANFTFYKNSSVFSSFNPDENEDREAIQAVVRNLLSNVAESDSSSLEDYVEEMTSGRLESQTHECKLLSVSDIIKDNNIDKIDLLKIDAEKSELDIIRGINDNDWNKIKQIVIEIHDKSGKILEEIESILKFKDFNIAVEEEKMLKQSGLFNVFARKNTLDEDQALINSQLKSKEERLIENIDHFSGALEAFSQRSSIPLIIAVAPRSTTVKSQTDLSSLYDKYESNLLEKVDKVPNTYTINSSSLSNTYPIQDYYDPQGDELGHIPYTLPFFTSIGTAIFRLIFSLQNNPYKVVALDCDNTLWQGVCGEDGPKGIKISESYRYLQQFMIDQIQTGMLVCLCSKNNEEDVMEVFKQRDDMLLKTEHLVSWRTNWDFKSMNLRSLAEELNLGLDSFIFIDDNPVECAEVKANCPEVLTLQLPQEEAIPGFLKNIWAFDHLKVTEEDKKRTKMYQENIQREKYLSNSLTLKDFLDGLNLQIKISQPKPEQMERVSQLTFRTNQFNFTTIRRSETEINNLLKEDDYNCMITHVSDRFGDYGLVGVLIYKIEKEKIVVDTFLLSCRVLGRGVEHKILSELGTFAIDKGVNVVEVKYLQTKKNQPALDFIDSFGKEYKSEISGGFKYSFTSEFLRNLKYEPTSFAAEKNGQKSEKKQKKPTIKISGNYNEKLQQIGIEFQDPNVIFRRVEEFKVDQSKAENINYVAPETEFEMKLVEIWQTVLGVNKIGLDDNFFEVGGTSLKAVQLIATVKKEFKKSISVITLFECPTVRLLSKKLGGNEGKDESKAKFEDHIERGARRRQKTISRKRS